MLTGEESLIVDGNESCALRLSNLYLFLAQ